MSLEKITEDPSSSESLPDFDKEDKSEDIPGLSEMIDNFAKHGQITGRSREPSQEPLKNIPSQEPSKNIKEENPAEDTRKRENPWTASQEARKSKEEDRSSRSQQQASSSSVGIPTGGKDPISLKQSPRRSGSTGREIARSRGATPIRRTSSRDRYPNKVKGMTMQEMQEMKQEQARRQEIEAGKAGRPEEDLGR